MYECFHCGERAVIWDGDFTLGEWEPDAAEDGLVHVLHCSKCGAEIVYTIKEEDGECTKR